MDHEETSVATITPPEKKSHLLHIMHVDDDRDLRLLISASLRDFGYFVATAGSVAEALQLARELRFNLFILDVRLPDGTGVELCQELQELQPGVPVIYYSAYASDEEQKAALSVCGDAYLKKPVSAEYLQQTIARLLPEAAIGSLDS
ncbi:MAG: response regulator [Chthoniobacterales bacterium]